MLVFQRAILTQNEFASNARNGMAWSHLTEIK